MLERVEMLTCVEELKMNYYLDKTKKKKNKQFTSTVHQSTTNASHLSDSSLNQKICVKKSLKDSHSFISINHLKIKPIISQN